MSPLFSTIVPVHNRAELIAFTLDSVLEQGSSDQEVIVVDDGSTDETSHAIIKRYGQRVRVLRQENKGPGAARNLGVRHASGDYIAFLDSDDLWMPWTLETYRRVIEQCGRPSLIAGQAFDFRAESDIGRIGRDDLRITPLPDLLASERLGLFFGASWLLVRRDAFLAAGGFTDRWINAEDHDLSLRLGTARGFVKIESPITFAFRCHAHSASSVFPKTLEGVWHLVHEEFGGRYPGGATRRRQRHQLVSHCARPVIIACARADAPTRRAGWGLYLATFGWHLRLGRFRFLAAFPVIAVATWLRSLGKREAPSTDDLPSEAK